MDLHKLLKSYEYDDKYYRCEADVVLMQYITDYTDAHPGFHCYGVKVEDSNPELYYHFVLVYWTDGHRPTLNTFNFKKEG